MKTRIRPSRTRSIGPRERAFMLGDPIGDFEPELMPLGETLGEQLEYRPQFEGSSSDCAFKSHGNLRQVARDEWRYEPPRLLPAIMCALGAVVLLGVYGLLVRVGVE